jgi:hypothetical protein
MTSTVAIPSFAQSVYASVVSGRIAGLAYREAWLEAKDDAAKQDAVKFNASVACIAAQLAKLDAKKAITLAGLKCSDTLWTEAVRVKMLSVKARKNEGEEIFKAVRTADVAHLRIRGAAGLIEAPAKKAGETATKDAKPKETPRATLEQINDALKGARAKSRGDVEMHVMALCVDAEHFPKANANVWPMGQRGEAMRKALLEFAKAIRNLPNE